MFLLLNATNDAYFTVSAGRQPKPTNKAPPIRPSKKFVKAMAAVQPLHNEPAYVTNIVKERKKRLRWEIEEV